MNHVLPLLRGIALGAALLGTGSACALPNFFSALSIPTLLDVLKQAGLETRAKPLDDGRMVIPVSIEGRVAILLPYGCNDAQCPQIDSLQALAWVDIRSTGNVDHEALLEHVNAFNAKYPYGRAYVGDNNRVLLELDMYTGAGLTPGRLGSFLGGLSGLQEAFEEHMAAFQAKPATPPAPATPPQPLTPPEVVSRPATPPTPPAPAIPPAPGRTLFVRITQLEDGAEGCRIHGRIDNRGEDSFQFIDASLLVVIPTQSDRYEYIGFNAGKGFVIGKPGQPLGPGDSGGSVATVKGVACEAIDHLVFEEIAFCGDGPPFRTDCTDATAIVAGGPIRIIDKPNRMFGDPVPVVPAEAR